MNQVNNFIVVYKLCAYGGRGLWCLARPAHNNIMIATSLYD